MVKVIVLIGLQHCINGYLQGMLKYPSYLANKEIQGLKANLDKLKLFYQLIPEEYRDGNVDWDNLQTEVKDS